MTDIKNQKVLIFSTAYFPFIGGAEVAVKELTDRINDLQFDLITAKMDNKLSAFERVGKVNVYRVGFGSKLDKFLLPFLGLSKALHLDKKNKYDAAWSIMASQASIAAAFFKIFQPRAKLILTLQEGDEEEHLKRYAFNSDFLYKIFIRPWHLLVFKKANRATAISNDLKKRALRNGVKCEVEVVPNGVDIDKFQIPNDHRFSGIPPTINIIKWRDKFQINSKSQIQNLKRKLGIKENEKIVITTSRLVKKNGVGDLVEAVNILIKNYKLPIKLIICGEGELREELELRAASCELRDNVIFMGKYNNNDLPQYLAISDVFCRPSLSEGLGISFLEAMAAEVPIVATPVGGIPDFLVDGGPDSVLAETSVAGRPAFVPQGCGTSAGKTGWFCQVKNPESIAEKIKYILDEKNAEEVKKVVANARKLVAEKYNWDKIALKMRSLL